MPFIIADRVRETSTTVGTGNIALGGAVTGFRTFASVMATADTTYYTIADQGGPNWEVGLGTFTAPSTLARTMIFSSSNGGSIVTFGAGTKDVFISLPAPRTVQSFSAGSTGLTPSTDSYGAITLAGTLAVGNGGTGATTAPNALTNLGAVAKAGDTMTGVLGVVAGTNSAPGLTFSGDTNTGVFSPAADTIALATNGTEDFRIGPAGQIGLQGANYGTSGQVLTSNGAAAAPSWQTISSGGVTSFNTRTGAVTLSSGDVTTALGYTPVNRAGDTMTGDLTISKATPAVPLTNTSNSTTRRLQYDGTNIGFTLQNGNWAEYTNNSGQMWTAAYGWLHDFFFNNVSNCANCGGNFFPSGRAFDIGLCSPASTYNCFVTGGQLNDGGATISRSDYYAGFLYNCNCACNC